MFQETSFPSSANFLTACESSLLTSSFWCSPTCPLWTFEWTLLKFSCLPSFNSCIYLMIILFSTGILKFVILNLFCLYILSQTLRSLGNIKCFQIDKSVVVAHSWEYGHLIDENIKLIKHIFPYKKINLISWISIYQRKIV